MFEFCVAVYIQCKSLAACDYAQINHAIPQMIQHLKVAEFDVRCKEKFWVSIGLEEEKVYIMEVPVTDDIEVSRAIAIAKLRSLQ